MRYHELVCEAKRPATVSYFAHVTQPERLASILKTGLVPNHGGGNYDNVEWVSLDGVYASRNADHLRNYLFAHDMLSDFVILILAVAEGDSLPDEDLIDVVMQKAYEEAKAETGLDPEEPEEDEEVEFDDPFWGIVAQYFQRLATNGGKIARKNAAFVAELVEWWADFKIYQGGIGPDEWAQMKDKAVRMFPRIMSPDLGVQHSVRIPRTVGFDGSSRIVGALEVKRGNINVVYGSVPPEAQALVNGIIRPQDW